jgi:hypothetical protein
MGRRSSPILAGMTILIGLAALYLGAYLANVRTVTLATSGFGVWQKMAEYRVGGEFAELIFDPVHQCDRSIRKDYWLDYGVSNEFIPARKLVMRSSRYDYDDPVVAEHRAKLNMLINSIGPDDHPTPELLRTVNQIEFDLQRVMENSTKRPGPLYDYFPE